MLPVTVVSVRVTFPFTPGARIRSPVTVTPLRAAPSWALMSRVPGTSVVQVVFSFTSVWIMLPRMLTISARVMASVGRKRPSVQSVR